MKIKDNIFGNLTLTRNSKIIDITDKRFLDSYDINDLEVYSQIPRNVLTVYNEWFLIDEELYFFKSNYPIVELIMSEIFKEFDVKTLDYSIARYGNSIGIISKNFRKKGKEYTYYGDIDLKNFKNSTSYSELMESIYKVMSIDYLFGQTDRFSYNVLFEKEDSKLSLSPIYDSGNAFKNYSRYMYESCFGMLYFTDILAFKQQASNTKSLILNNSEFRNILLNSLTLDLETIIKRVIEKYGIKLNKDIKEFIIEYYDGQRGYVDSFIKRELKKN